MLSSVLLNLIKNLYASFSAGALGAAHALPLTVNVNTAAKK
jgi:hypothetical protein